MQRNKFENLLIFRYNMAVQQGTCIGYMYPQLCEKIDVNSIFTIFNLDADTCWNSVDYDEMSRNYYVVFHAICSAHDFLIKTFLKNKNINSIILETLRKKRMEMSSVRLMLAGLK